MPWPNKQVPQIDSTMRIVVLDGYTLNPGDNPWDPIAALGELEVYDRTPPELLLERARSAEILVVNKQPLTAGDLEQLPRLRLVAVSATGYNMVDLAAARRRGILVVNVPEYGTHTVAQFTWALILELCHHVGRHAASVAAGEWGRSPDFCYWLTPQIELAGQRLGVVGYGRIGRRVAQIGQALGMEVLACGRPGTPPPQDAVAWVDVDHLFRTAHVISLHVPLLPETERLVDARRLALVQPATLLVNTARGGLVDEQALADALHEGRLAGAALDVVSREPIGPDNPLLTAPRCLLTPHMAWAAHAARQRLMRTTAENIAAFLAGQPQNVVN